MRKRNIFILTLFSLAFNITAQKRPNKIKEKIPLHTIGEENSKYEIIQDLGLKVIDLTENERAALHLSSGIKVMEIYKVKAMHIAPMRVGFIILKVNNIPINSCEQFLDILSGRRECIVLLEGIYPDSPSVCYYAFELD